MMVIECQVWWVREWVREKKFWGLKKEREREKVGSESERERESKVRESDWREEVEGKGRWSIFIRWSSFFFLSLSLWESFFFSHFLFSSSFRNRSSIVSPISSSSSFRFFSNIVHFLKVVSFFVIIILIIRIQSIHSVLTSSSVISSGFFQWERKSLSRERKRKRRRKEERKKWRGKEFERIFWILSSLKHSLSVSMFFSNLEIFSIGLIFSLSLPSLLSLSLFCSSLEYTSHLFHISWQFIEYGGKDLKRILVADLGSRVCSGTEVRERSRNTWMEFKWPFLSQFKGSGKEVVEMKEGKKL